MEESDQEKTSFVTSQGLFCYKLMPFGLKNAGATYQRLINKMFAHQISRNVQVYVDDMLVKSLREDDHLDDLRETFDTYECKNERMKRYLEEVKYRIGDLEVKFVQIPREENECANHLAKATSAELMPVPE